MSRVVPNPDDRREPIRPPKFGLGTVFIGFVILGALFAVIHYFGAYGALIGLLTMLCIAAHFAGSMMGTRLRDNGDVPLNVDGTPTRSNEIVKPAPHEFAPTPRLGVRKSLGRRIMVITGTGSACAGVLGYFGLEWFSHGRLEWAAAAVGVAACVVLGAIWTFAAASFLQVIGKEFLEARRESPRP